jgi:hypothetical protein
MARAKTRANPVRKARTARRSAPRPRVQTGAEPAPAAAPTAVPAAGDGERAYAKELIERIVRECPRRQPTSEDERRSQEIVQEEFEKDGLATSWHHFKFNDNLYANIALHFGLGNLGTLVSPVAPLAAFVLHGLAAGSYWADSTRKAYVLRRLLGFKPSQNLLAVLPAHGKPRLRVVIGGHADAAFTGLIFQPRMIEGFTTKDTPTMRLFKRGLETATFSQAILAGVDLLRAGLGPLTWPLRPLELVVNLPALLAFVLNMEVVLRNQIVPGANDNLTGVAALPILAKRLMKDRRPDVEWVFLVTGCEEASLGGGDALARDMEGVWDRSDTVFLGLDSLTNGDLHYLEVEGEVIQKRIPEWLSSVLRRTAASDPRFHGVKGFEVPIGGSDVAAWLARGWQGVCLTALDAKRGAPFHYHMPEDTPENLDWDQFMVSVDFAEAVARNIVAERLGA